MSDTEQEYAVPEGEAFPNEEEGQQQQQGEEKTHLSVSGADQNGHKPMQRKQSLGGASRRSSRAPSAVEWDDDEREERHLLDHNAKLKEQVKNLKKTIRGLKEGAGGDLSANDEKSIETLNAESESYQADIEKYKEKAKKVNDIELLDTLLDDLTSRQIQVKGLELQRRQLGDAKRSNMKTLHGNEDTPSRQKVFLELKDERRRQNQRLAAAQDRKEKLAEQITLIQRKAEEFMEKVVDLGLTDVNVPSVINMKKKDEEQVKQIEKLRSQIAAVNGSFETMKTKTNWTSRDKDVVLEELRSEIDKVKTQIAAKEQLIISNQAGGGEKPPHFVAPLNAKPSPRRPPPKSTSQSSAGAATKKPSAGGKGALKPSPPPPKKGDSPQNKHYKAQGGGGGDGSAPTSQASSPTGDKEEPDTTAADDEPKGDEGDAEDGGGDYSDDYNSPSPKKKDNSDDEGKPAGGDEDVTEDEYKEDE